MVSYSDIYPAYGSWWFYFNGETCGPYWSKEKAFQALTRKLSTLQVAT